MDKALTECFVSVSECCASICALTGCVRVGLAVVFFGAMAKHSWPTAVTSWDDTVKFAQLLFGTDIVYENYSERLPVPSNESFLLFAKGVCKTPRLFNEIATLIPEQLSEIKEYEMLKRGNHSNPLKSQQMLSRHKQVHYVSCQVTRSPCGCRNVFGADAHQYVIPTSSGLWKAGRASLASCWSRP